MSSVTIKKSTAEALRLVDITNEKAGGKALGLNRLIKAGANVPEGIVILNPYSNELREVLSNHAFISNGKPKAVRSSAVDEDGQTASFAGQFETYLNVNGVDDIIEAVKNCAQSAKSGRVANYSSRMDPGANLQMAVVIQEMIEPDTAGVLFTANPINNRRDHLIINAVKGLGEDLVSGLSAGELHVLTRSGAVIEFKSEYQDKALSDNLVKQLTRESIQIEKYFGDPIDLEWAIDKTGKIFWLQARPITTLKQVHLNELDDYLDQPDMIFTRGNIGEMMPGPVTPLTYSTFAWAIDIGLQRYMNQIGAQPKISDKAVYVSMFYNHLFFSMSSLYNCTRRVTMTTQPNLEYAIMGFTLPDIKIEREVNFILGAINTVRYFIYISKSEKRFRLLKKLAAGYSIALIDDPNELYNKIDSEMKNLILAWDYHYATSVKSGANNTILVSILSGGKVIPDQENLKDAASLLINISDIDGADALQALDNLAEHIVSDPEHRDKFLNIDPKNPQWLYTDNSGKTGELFRNFMKINGHRCVREAEMRETDWQTDPSSLIEILQIRVKGDLISGGNKNDMEAQYRKNYENVLKKVKPAARFFTKKIISAARSSVAKRENSKSICVKLQSEFKKAYIHLGNILAEKELLDDFDQIFFLTHKEIGILLKDKNPKWKSIAEDRRKLFPKMKALHFKDLYYGIPEPAQEIEIPVPEDGSYKGLPVSTGSLQGKVKIINSLDDARKLEPGDIMIASYTDVGWTPYFSIIGGLVTEIGSALSHGAVVAREYGIPAVVSVRGAKKAFKDGDMVFLDGDKGTIKKI